MNLIHFENSWGLADKPAGLSVHNDPGNDLQSLLTQKLKQSVHLVNRLDSETSGLVLFTTRPDLVPPLQDSLSNINSEKIYQSIVRGNLKLPSKEDWQTWSWPLSDKSEGRKNPQGEKNQRKECLTKVRILSQNKYVTRLENWLVTGRQHQIRKHSALSGHAIVGDSRYGETAYNAKIAKIYGTARLFLHCHRLKLVFEGKNHEFISEVPQVFADFFE